MTTALLCALVIMPGDAKWPKLVNAVAQIESGGNHAAIGKKGERGAWQISEKAWESVFNSVPHSAAHNPVSGELAGSWLLMRCFYQLSRALGRPPTVQELYAAWNLGFSGFKKRGFKLSKCPKSTRDAGERLVNLIEQ